MQLTSSASIGELLPAPTGPPALPKYITEDHMKLTFQAYFKEAVRESADESWRIRKCVITYFLVDDTVRMDEIVGDNTGIWGGPFLSRRKLSRKDGSGPLLYTDFLVGKQVEVFSRTFQVYGCDQRTRNYLESRGIFCEPDVPAGMITDSFTKSRSEFQSRETGADLTKFRGKTMYPMKTHIEALLGRHTRPFGSEKRAFDYGNQALSLRLVWNDSGRLYGDARKVYNMKYYLADRTCEVRQMLQKNSGQDPFPLFVKRCRLPKSSQSLASSGSIGGGEDTGTPDGSYFTDEDFEIGMTVTIFNRPMVIVDCNDLFTRDYYKTVHGREMQAHSDKLSMTTAPKKEWPKREIPPPTGYGNDEDSMGSVRKLRPTQPRRDLAKLNKMAGKTLGFMSRLISTAPSDQGRRFVIRYYLADDTIQVYETVIANSGLVGGRFLNRMRMKRPNGKYFSPADLYQGAVVTLFKFQFEIIDMDSNTRIYKATGDDEHMTSTDINAVVKKLLLKLRSSKSKLAKVFRDADEDKNGMLTFSEMKKLLENLLGDQTLTDSDVAQVMLFFDMHDLDGFIDYEELAKRVFNTESTRFESEARGHFQHVGTSDVTRGVRRKESAKYLEVLKQSEKDLQEHHEVKQALFRFVEMFEHNSTSFGKTFRKLDKDHSGEFEKEEFFAALRELNVPGRDAECVTEHYFADRDVLNISEFMKMLSSDSVLLIGQHRKL